MSPNTDNNAIQLTLIHEMTNLLQQAGIAHWLFGGWAADFHLGRMTRPHEDIDLIIWRNNAPAVRVLLAAHAYAELPPDAQEQDLHTHFAKQGQNIDVMFIYRKDADDADGVYWADWRWPDGSFAPTYRTLDGIACPVASVRSLVETKESYLRSDQDQIDREKYQDDLSRLRPLSDTE